VFWNRMPSHRDLCNGPSTILPPDSPQLEGFCAPHPPLTLTLKAVVGCRLRGWPTFVVWSHGTWPWGHGRWAAIWWRSNVVAHK
jgi:hypothetical protein